MSDTSDNKPSRRNAISSIFGAAVGSTIVLTTGAVSARADIIDPIRRWLDRILRHPGPTIPIFLRSVADSLEAGNSNALVKYQRANPDFQPDPGALGKGFPWKLVGTILVAIGEWMQRHDG